ncbi:hypothetical protein K6I34_000465 [Streptomyces sp. UNOC14_S4]|nr:hypothetical protein [Streptomyces sp. UNOC14_S4]
MTDAQSSARASARTETPMAGVVHVRHRHDTHFTVVGNHLAQHLHLSAVAIGIGVYIQSLPDGALVGIKDLTRRFREGEIAIARALKELEAAGYLERRRVRCAGGRMATLTSWYEHPEHRERCAASAPRPRRRPPTNPARRHAGPAPALADRPSAPQAPPVGPADRPVGPADRPVDLVKRRRPVDTPLPPIDQATDRTAVDLLAGLRRRDPRLLLSERDVQILAPDVRAWLDRGVGPVQLARTLGGELPMGVIARPARLLAYRLREWLPPALPTQPLERPEQQRGRPPLPFQTCDGCERAFRAAAPGRCRDCRTALSAAGPAA